MTSPPTLEQSVRYLNVDVHLFETFDAQPLLRALGGKVHVLHDDVVIDRERLVTIEVARPNRSFVYTLTRLVRTIELLPDDARRAWDEASRRSFNVGIQGGRTPWTKPGRSRHRCCSRSPRPAPISR